MAQTPESIWMFDRRRLRSDAEKTLFITLQGLANRTSPQIFIMENLTPVGMTRVVTDELVAEGAQVKNRIVSVLDLLDEFPGVPQGYILFDDTQQSLNVATSLAGPLNSVAIDASLEEALQARGYSMTLDVRGWTAQKLLDDYASSFTKGMVIEQPMANIAYLRDFGVMRNLFTYFNGGADFRKSVGQTFGPQNLVFGWGENEGRWVEEISEGGSAGVPADWCRNLSAYAGLPAELPEPPRAYPEPAQPGQRIVCFVMTDGDNIQWITGGFVDHPGFWAYSGRGNFNMSWEMSPVLADVAPRVLRHLYQTASRGGFVDDFVAGPSGAGYTFMHNRPDPVGFAEQTGRMMDRARMRVISSINNPTGSMNEMTPLLERPEVMGIMYKGSPYDQFNGQVFWHKGKPSVSYRYELWNQDREGVWEDSIEGVAEQIAAQPSDPTATTEAYALVAVHAWSWSEIGGPMEAVKRVIDRLPEGTRVVGGEEFVILLRNHFGEPVSREKSQAEHWSLDMR